MINEILTKAEKTISEAIGPTCRVTSDQHTAAAVLDSNKPVIAVSDPKITTQAVYLDGVIDVDATVEVWIIHPHSENNTPARTFFSTVIPKLAAVCSANFDPVFSAIRNAQHPGYLTSLTVTHSIGEQQCPLAFVNLDPVF